MFSQNPFYFQVSRRLAIASLLFLSFACTGQKSSQTTAQSSPTRHSIQKLSQASQFFASALDESLEKPDVLKSKYCGIEQKDISLFSMQVKARMDQWLRDQTYSELPPVEQCASQCVCGVFVSISEDPINSKYVQEKWIAQAKKAQQLKSQESASTCLKELGDFCQSQLFQELKKSVQENQ